MLSSLSYRWRVKGQERGSNLSWFTASKWFILVQFSHSVMSNSLQPLGACQTSLSITNSWSLLKLMSIESVIPSNHLILSSPSPPTFNLSQHQGLFKWVCFFPSGGQSIGVSASASVLPMNIQEFPLGWTGWISLQSKEVSRVFSNTTVQKHQFLSVQPSLLSNSHMHTWLLEKP